MTLVSVTLNLSVSDEVLQYLRQEAKRRKVSLDVVVSDILMDYFDEPTEEEILQGLRISMQQALSGNVRPADEVLAELKEEFDFDSDERS